MASSSRWPNGAKAAVAFTMDNLGEAQDVNKGLWPADEPVGQHFSVTTHLPRMLDLLEHYGVRATFFAEAWSLSVYPHAVSELRRGGHEVAWHGFQHEAWADLSKDAEEDNFRRSFQAAEKAVVTYDGFRPPGGKLNERTWELLRRYGARYASPLGRFGVENGVVVLPFEWECVDAFYYMEKFAGIREAHGQGEDVLEPDVFGDYLLKKIDEAVKTGGYLSILFHPFLQTSEARFGVLETVLKRITGDPDIWLAPCNEVSAWVLEHQDAFTT